MLTAGRILAGYHEVVVDDAALEAVERARQDGRSTVRVSSTVFFHAHPDVVLQPLIEGPLAVAPIEAGTWLQQELKAIAMPVAKELQAH